MDILEILIIVSFFLMPVSEIFRIPLTSDLVVNPLDFVVGMLATVYFILLIVHKRRVPEKKIFISIFAFPLFGIASLLINSFWLNSSQFSVAFLYGLRLFSYTTLYFVALQLSNQAKRRVVISFFLVGFLILLFGYLQYFLYSNLLNLLYLGWDIHMYRMFSFFLDPNFAGAFFVVYVFFLSTCLVNALKQKKRNRIAFLTIILCFTLFAVFLTYSRSAILMFIVSSSVFLFFVKKKKFLFALFGLIGIVFIISSSKFSIENTNLLRTHSNEARLETTRNALAIFSDHPLLGIGFNSYRYAQVKYRFRHANTPLPSHADAGVDNSFLFVLATTGIIGFLFYLWQWKTLLIQKGKVGSIVALSISIGFFVDALFINSLFFAPFLLILFVGFGVLHFSKISLRNGID